MKKLLAGLMLIVAAMGFGFAQSGTSFSQVLLTMAKAAGISTVGGPTAILAQLIARGLVEGKWANLPLDQPMSLNDFKVFVADVLNGTAAAPSSVAEADGTLQAKGLDLSKIDSGSPDAVGSALTTVVSSPAVGPTLASGYNNPISPKR